MIIELAGLLRDLSSIFFETIINFHRLPVKVGGIQGRGSEKAWARGKKSCQRVNNYGIMYDFSELKVRVLPLPPD